MDQSAVVLYLSGVHKGVACSYARIDRGLQRLRVKIT